MSSRVTGPGTRRRWVVAGVALAGFAGCRDRDRDRAPQVVAPTPDAGFALVAPRTVMTAFSGVCYLDAARTIRCFDEGDHCISRPPDGTFAAIAGTEAYACALDDAGALTCWGDGTSEPPPLERARQVSVGKPHSCALALDHTVRCWGHDYHGSLEVPAGTFKAIAVGHNHSCGLRPDRSVTCWGWNTSGQTDAPPGPFEHISAGLQLSCGIRPGGELVCWGMDTVVPDGEFADVWVEGFRNCALRTSGKAVCWGPGPGDVAEHDGGPYVELVDQCARTAAGAIECLWSDGAIARDDGTSRYADADGACPWPPAPATPRGPVRRRPWIATAMALVRDHDVDAIEHARDQVEAGDVPALVEEYGRLRRWQDKELLVQLVQDQASAALTPVMEDFLDHPDCDDEPCAWSRAVALSHLDGNDETFTRYLDDPALARARLAMWKARRGQ